ncbi:hypothetical protein RJ55_06698 [Drechmeria coniospora]|nr:hypothetical protein RJ55_06698 [Drechmeria coniospora]
MTATLHLTVRFSTSIPDLELDIPSPQTTTVLSLKALLRGSLATRNRLRLIHQGRILPDSSALGAVLKPLAPPPAPLSTAARDRRGGAQGDGRGKGKAAVDAPPPRVYVNCSIGDELSQEELAAEEAAAADPPDSTAGHADAAGLSRARRGHGSSSGLASATTRPRPRGFDRLLQAGFSTSEISTLRTQFESIHTERFAPDSLPSPDTLRRLEDAWIDTNAGELPSVSAGGAAPAEDDMSAMSTVLDILIRGMMIGFFFPLGSVTWLLRQGLWGEKWQIFVGSGVVLSLIVGIVMGIPGDR